MGSAIDPEFFDLYVYSVYKAIYEIAGEKTWSVVWRSGEIVFDKIKDEVLVPGDLFKSLENLASFLKKSGYIADININRVSEDEIEYIMSEPVIARSKCKYFPPGGGAKRLIEEGMVPPHISTSLMFACLKYFGMRAEMVGEPIFLPDGRVVERWRVVKA